ncbi:MAG: hypothetical protein ACLU38_07120 [Dysosmobacter sp.]
MGGRRPAAGQPGAAGAVRFWLRGFRGRRNCWCGRCRRIGSTPPTRLPTLEEFAQSRLHRTGDPGRKAEALLHTMACKAAIKGGWTSDLAELKILVEKVQSGEVRYCPHGRPVVVKVTKYELEKLFKRA